MESRLIITLVGGAASIASAVSFMPQAWHIIRNRDASGISLRAYSVTTIGFSLWLTYGILLGEWPLIVTNSICLLLSLFIVVVKLLPQHKLDDVADAVETIVPSDSRS